MRSSRSGGAMPETQTDGADRMVRAQPDGAHPDGTWRLIAAALALGALCSAGVLTALRADAQARAPAAPAAPAAASAPAAAAGPSDASVIQDDPTVAPDARESADDNLTFPTDI